MNKMLPARAMMTKETIIQRAKGTMYKKSSMRRSAIIKMRDSIIESTENKTNAIDTRIA